MGRKTMRKYKGGLTPRKSTLKKLAPRKLAPTTKRKISDEYYGFKLKPLYKSSESYGFSTSLRSPESYGFSTSSRKKTARIKTATMILIEREDNLFFIRHYLSFLTKIKKSDSKAI